jgi:acetyl esterase/lipase
MAVDILELPPPPYDVRLPYGSDPNQFGDLRLPKAHFPKAKGSCAVVMNLHGGFWRAKYDLAHAGHLCAAVTGLGFATWNVEYRRVGNAGGGWPGTLEDIVSAYRHLPQLARRYPIDPSAVLVMGHSAGGQLAICMAAHEPTIKRTMALAGVLDLERAYQLHLSNDAVVEFLGGTPKTVAEHYAEADPRKLPVLNARQVVVHGAGDDVVPPDFSRQYADQKKKQGETVTLVEIARAGHFELIDPRSGAWAAVASHVQELMAS